MRASACLWGGAYNPIIPVSRTQPTAWRSKRFQNPTGWETARGYVRFFEPDVYVEAEPGLAQFVGLKGLDSPFGGGLMALDELLAPERDRTWAEPGFGLSALDILKEKYRTERQFELRDPQSAIVIREDQECAGAEAIFGCYPRLPTVDYFERGYRDVYKPDEVDWSPETWLRRYRDGAVSPFSVIGHGLDCSRHWHHEPVVFIFDQTKSVDLIDLWNLRLEPSPILPVPIDWLDSLNGFLRDRITEHHRPLEGNSHGVSHRMTLEVARSIGEDRAEPATRGVTEGLPKGAVSIKSWRTPIWREHRETMISAPIRMKITAEEGDANLQSDGDEYHHTSFNQLVPEFAETYGRAHARWANVLAVRSYSPDDKVGTVIPFNTFDRSWPNLLFIGGTQTPVTTEGWVVKGRYKGRSETLSLLTPDEVVHGALKERGIQAELSEPGRIGKQMLQRLGSLWNVHLLRDAQTLKLLNKMAGSLRRRSSEADNIEESFAGRTASLVDWKNLLRDREKRGRGTRSLEEFTSRDIIRVGLETACPHCAYKNWSGLDAVNYTISCERCLNPYPFPQGDIARGSENFRYRVVGPFAVPDYALGSYSALLALAALRTIGGTSDAMTFATATDLSFEGHKCEADFLAIRENKNGDHVQSPDFIIGECKSFGEGDLIKDGDIAKLKSLCTKLPGATVAITVLRDSFTSTECARLKKFVEWARRPDASGMATNPVLLLTGNEVFGDGYIHTGWEKLGAPHADYTDFHQTKDLRSLAEATQGIYLGVPPQYEWPKRRQQPSRKGTRP